jgi:hypothetical protein
VKISNSFDEASLSSSLSQPIDGSSLVVSALICKSLQFECLAKHVVLMVVNVIAEFLSIYTPR